MNDLLRQRLANERRLLETALPRLAAFVGEGESFGDPPVAWGFVLQPFGFVVRAGDRIEPFDPVRHGSLALLLSIDPERYPWTPWRVVLRGRPDVSVVNPHVSVRAAAPGAVCWIDGQRAFRPGDWPVSRVLPHVLRILAGEVFELEGFNLHDEGKDWFAAHRDRLPFARVPYGLGEAPLAGRDPARPAAVPGSSGIEILGLADPLAEQGRLAEEGGVA